MKLKGKLLSIVLYPPKGGKYVNFIVEEIPDELKGMEDIPVTITVERREDEEHLTDGR